MTLKASTGLRNQLCDTGSLKSILAGGYIKLYSGTPPATADAAIDVSNVLLCTITAAAGAGLTLGTAVSGAIPKTASETWSGVNSAGGVATFYRHAAVGDTAIVSTTQARVQGTISMVGDDMNLTAGTTLVNGATQTLNLYQLYIPTL